MEFPTFSTAVNFTTAISFVENFGIDKKNKNTVTLPVTAHVFILP